MNTFVFLMVSICLLSNSIFATWQTTKKRYRPELEDLATPAQKDALIRTRQELAKTQSQLSDIEQSITTRKPTNEELQELALRREALDKLSVYVKSEKGKIIVTLKGLDVKNTRPFIQDGMYPTVSTNFGDIKIFAGIDSHTYQGYVDVYRTVELASLDTYEQTLETSDIAILHIETKELLSNYEIQRPVLNIRSVSYETTADSYIFTIHINPYMRVERIEDEIWNWSQMGTTIAEGCVNCGNRSVI